MSTSGFLFIPEHIMERDDLSLQEKVIYGRVIGLTKKEGYCFISNEMLGSKLGLTGDRVSRYLSSLSKKGFLYIEVSKNKKGEGAPNEWGTRRKIFAFLPETPNGLGENPIPPLGINPKYSITEFSNTDSLSEKELTDVEDESLDLPVAMELAEGQSPSVPNQDFHTFLESKAKRKVVRALKAKHGGQIPSWVNVDKEVVKEVESTPSVSLTQEYRDFCSFISKDRRAIHIPTVEGQRLWNKLLAEGYLPAHIKCAARIAYRVDGWWSNQFTPELFFRKKSSSSGESIDNVGKFLNYRAAGNEDIVAIKQDMKHELEG